MKDLVMTVGVSGGAKSPVEETHQQSGLDALLELWQRRVLLMVLGGGLGGLVGPVGVG
jgi:hypothetical protein